MQVVCCSSKQVSLDKKSVKLMPLNSLEFKLTLKVWSHNIKVNNAKNNRLKAPCCIKFVLTLFKIEIGDISFFDSFELFSKQLWRNIKTFVLFDTYVIIIILCVLLSFSWRTQNKFLNNKRIKASHTNYSVKFKIIAGLIK